MHMFLVVGQNYSALRSKIVENGDDYLLLQDKKTTKYPEKRFKRRIVADFSSKTTLLEAVLPLKGKVDGVVCMYENYVLAAAWIAEALGVPGLPVKSAEACTDKQIMRHMFAQSPHKISVDFTEVHSEKDVLDFAKNHRFPLILKPANLVKSLLISKSHTERELLSNYQKMLASLDSTYQKYAPNRTPKVIIEEFIEGSVHSVDAFVDSQGTLHIIDGIVDYQTGYDIGYDDNFHYSRLLPSSLSAADQKALFTCAERGVCALGMKNTPAHIEVIMSKQGPRIVEIGARNGGYRERMYRFANDIDVLQNTLRLALGQKPTVTISRHEPCAVLELFPKNSGKFIELAHSQELNQLPSLEYLRIRAKPGDHIGKSSDGYKAAAIIILHHRDPTQFQKDLEYVNENVAVLTD